MALKYLNLAWNTTRDSFLPFMHASRHKGTSVYLAKPIKQHIEVGQHCSPGNLHYIIKGLTGVVAQTAVRVIETSKNRINEFFQVQSRILSSTKDKINISKAFIFASERQV